MTSALDSSDFQVVFFTLLHCSDYLCYGIYTHCGTCVEKACVLVPDVFLTLGQSLSHFVKSSIHAENLHFQVYFSHKHNEQKETILFFSCATVCVL